MLVSSQSWIQGISITGFPHLILAPLPLRATVTFDVEYLVYYGWIIYYPLLILFFIGAYKIFINRPRLVWLLTPIIMLVLILGITIPGGSRRRDCFLPAMYIVSAYGLIRALKEKSYTRPFNPK